MNTKVEADTIAPKSAKLARLQKESTEFTSRWADYAAELVDLEKRRRSLASRMVRHPAGSDPSKEARDEIDRIYPRIKELHDILDGFGTAQQETRAAIEAATLEVRRKEREKANGRIRELLEEHRRLTKDRIADAIVGIEQTLVRVDEIGEAIRVLRRANGAPGAAIAYMSHYGKGFHETIRGFLRGRLWRFSGLGIEQRGNVNGDPAHFWKRYEAAVRDLEIPGELPSSSTPAHKISQPPLNQGSENVSIGTIEAS